ncbi:hypothetical protein ALO58_200114 [Pseudomonas savastanoi pv. savastanoi]|nr:hypothetical protein ALO58_200114 [Pseudomonas savastanoi pv. savastanoi]
MKRHRSAAATFPEIFYCCRTCSRAWTCANRSKHVTAAPLLKRPHRPGKIATNGDAKSIWAARVSIFNSICQAETHCCNRCVTLNAIFSSGQHISAQTRSSCLSIPPVQHSCCTCKRSCSTCRSFTPRTAQPPPGWPSRKPTPARCLVPCATASHPPSNKHCTRRPTRC